MKAVALFKRAAAPVKAPAKKSAPKQAKGSGSKTGGWLGSGSQVTRGGRERYPHDGVQPF